MHLGAWVGFLSLIAFFLALDLGVFHKKDEVVSAKSALTWTAVWFTMSCLFNVVIYHGYETHLFGLGTDVGSVDNGKDAAIQYFTGYLVELSLSLDNIFVIALIFRFFKVPALYQHRILFWGILGALVLRIAMILAGAALIKNFSATTYVFGGILVFTAAKMALQKGDEEFDPENSAIVKIVRRFVRISPNLDGHNFFTTVDGHRMATPLFLVLIIVEGTDVVFAVDSIPAIFGVTQDPFLVFTSNIFAIMGLRSLYFAHASLLNNFVYLKHSLIVVLAFVGVKMIIAGWPGVHVPPLASLGVIVGVLAMGVVASLVFKKEAEEDLPPASVGLEGEPAAASSKPAPAPAKDDAAPPSDA
jgi:tellurite resistance protein TerC